MGLLFLYFFFTIHTSIGFSNYFLSNSARQVLHNLDQESNINISYYLFGTFYLWGRMYYKLKYDTGNNFLTIIVAISLLFTAAKMNFVFATIGILLILFHYKKYTYKKVFKRLIPLFIAFFTFLISFSIFTGKVIDKNVGSISSTLMI